MDILLPDVRLAQVSSRLIDATGRFNSPLSGTTRTVARPGDRWGLRLDYKNLLGVDRGRLEGCIANQRGAANRLLFSPVVEFPGGGARGSFPDNELFTNNNFSSALAGTWGTEGAGMTITLLDRRVRAVRNLYDGTAGGLVAPKNATSVTLTAYVPYVIRFFVSQGRGIPAGCTIYNDVSADGITANSTAAVAWLVTQSPAFGMLRGVRVPETTGGYAFGAYNPATTGLAGDYYDVDWASCSQCALVDNGANVLQYSDDFTQAIWTKNRVTVSLSAARAPDGTLTADSIVEDSSTNTHYVQQNFTVGSSAQDICLTVAANSASRNWVALQLFENTGSTGCAVYFNTSAGTIGTTTTGANWSNVRSYIKSLGNGWFQLCLVARKTNAATSISAQLFLASADNTPNYAGTGSNGLQMWRATVAISPVPVRLVQSASASVAATAQTGNALYVKGLPVSSSGLLLPGDWIECNQELKRITNALNSDAAGLGYLQFSPPLRNSPNDNDPIIVNSPMGRFIMSNTENGWASVPGYFSTSSLDLVEAA